MRIGRTWRGCCLDYTTGRAKPRLSVFVVGEGTPAGAPAWHARLARPPGTPAWHARLALQAPGSQLKSAKADWGDEPRDWQRLGQEIAAAWVSPQSAVDIELVPVTTVLAQQAAILAADQRLRGCDAIFVALAQQRADTLYTLDRQQIEPGAVAVATRQPA